MRFETAGGTRGRRALVALWALALLVGVLNAAIEGRRAPLLSRQRDDLDKQAVEGAARRLARMPDKAPVLLLLSHHDLGSVWFRQRLTYLIYPRRTEVAWDALPTEASRRPLVLAFNSMQTALPATWERLERTAHGTLAAPIQGQLPPSPAASSAQEGSALGRPPVPLRFLLAIFGLAFAPALGALLLERTAPEASFGVWWGNLALAHLVGATATAWLVTALALLTGHLLVWPIYALASALLPFRRRSLARLFRPGEAADAPPDASSRSSLGSAAKWAFALMIALGAAVALERGKLIGLEWDGYAIWQLKAKAFALDGDLSLLRDATHFPYAHLDYPPLTAIQSWWVYAHFGGVEDRWAQAVNFLFYADLLACFGAFARRYVPASAALAGVALLAMLPVLTAQALSGFADIPFAVYFLAAAFCLTRLTAERDAAFAPTLAWLCAGLVLVKNEGQAACLGVLVIGALTLLVLQRSKDAKRESPSPARGLVTAGICAVLAYAPWLAVKLSRRLANDLMQRQAALTPERVLLRVGYAIQGFAGSMARIGPRFPCWGLLGLLLLVGAAISVRRNLALTYPLWGLAGFQLIVYIGIYVITPHDPLWHIRSSVDRLTLHLVPVLTLAALIAAFRRPEEMKSEI